MGPAAGAAESSAFLVGRCGTKSRPTRKVLFRTVPAFFAPLIGSSSDKRAGQRVQVNGFGRDAPHRAPRSISWRNNGISEQDRTTVAGPDLQSTSQSASDTLRHRGPLT